MIYRFGRLAAAFAVIALTLTGCHLRPHVPPGQAKKVFTPTGVGVPPGQAKKRR